VSDENGNFFKDGKFVGGSYALDITDEVKAWMVHSKLSNTGDRIVKGGSRHAEFQFRILDELDKAKTAADKADVLAKIAYSDLNKRSPNETNNPVSPGFKKGSIVRTKLISGRNIQYFGRAR
jgi:hypothetical protein